MRGRFGVANNGDSKRISVERLMGSLTAFDQDVEIIARPRRKNYGDSYRISA
jgi:hypothetical protein